MSKKNSSVKNIEPAYIRQLANRYTSNRYISFESLAHETGYSAKTVSNILFRGIAENILSDETSELIFKKVISAHSSGVYQRQKRWEQAFKARNEMKYERISELKEALRKLKEVEAYYIHLIRDYDCYNFEEEGAPTKEELEEKLANTREKIKKLHSLGFK